MTNEQAIEELKGLQKFINGTRLNGEIRVEAFDLAIKALETGEIYITGEDYNLYMEGYKAGKRDFEPKQGEWIAHEDMDEWYECNKCHCGNTYFDKLPNFCPNCGADMRGAK